MYMENEIYSIDDICKMFQISRKTAYNWNENGTLKFTKIGGKIIYFKSLVDKKLNELKKEIENE